MFLTDYSLLIISFRLIVYDPWMKKISGLKHEVSMDFYPETFSSYSPRSGLYLKFQAKIKNIQGKISTGLVGEVAGVAGI